MHGIHRFELWYVWGAAAQVLEFNTAGWVELTLLPMVPYMLWCTWYYFLVRVAEIPPMRHASAISLHRNGGNLPLRGPQTTRHRDMWSGADSVAWTVPSVIMP